MPGDPGPRRGSLLATFGTLEALLDAAARGDPRLLGWRQLAARDYLLRAALVVHTARTLGPPSLATPISPAPPSTARLAELAARWGIGDSLARAATALGVLPAT